MVKPPTKFSKRGELTGPQLLEGVAGKVRGDFFQREGEKSEIFNNIFLSHN